ncbi:hypothetical protein J3458_009235 [Metarhizium acridum]|uniref:uncharacterized protein n=1 Tax=Metarhizium acridum TaxID=92637 RepID=UPI001C6C68EC|nr:hypothetical protein J3458_009235 [Metarhizium acridum]
MSRPSSALCLANSSSASSAIRQALMTRSKFSQEVYKSAVYLLALSSSPLDARDLHGLGMLVDEQDCIDNLQGGTIFLKAAMFYTRAVIFNGQVNQAERMVDYGTTVECCVLCRRGRWACAPGETAQMVPG